MAPYTNDWIELFDGLDTVVAWIELCRCHGPGVVAGSRTMQLSNITDAISKFVLITHECMDSKELIM